MKKTASLAICALFVSVSMVTVVGCKKYEDGPAISFRSKQHRVVNTWALETYFQDGVDKTSELTVTNYTEIYNEDGSCKRTFNDASGDFVDQPGTWAFSDDKAKININGIGSVELSQSLGTVSASSITLLRLKEKEMWYKFDNGGHSHEFHLKQK